MFHYAETNPVYLLEQFSDLVKQCQIRFINPYELATECEKIVVELCDSIEQLFDHGFNVNSNFYHKHKLPDSLKPPAKGSDIRFWNFICLYLTDYEVKRFQALRNVHSDRGRARSWLRNTLNEHSLEKSFALILEDKPKYRRYFYRPESLWEKATLAPVLRGIARNLGRILFALNIDYAELDLEKGQMEAAMVMESLAPVVRRSQTPAEEEKEKTIPIKVGQMKKRSNVIKLEGEEKTEVEEEGNSLVSEVDIYEMAHSAPVSKFFTSPGGCSAAIRPANQLALLTPTRLDRGSQSSLHSLGTSRTMVLVPIANDQSAIPPAETPNHIAEKLEVIELEKEKMMKENNLLKIQLKKYMAAIELMKYNTARANEQEKSGETTPATTAGLTSVAETEANLVPSLYNDIAGYERKLVQVSEMHGELVEFNEHLYRVIQQKDSIIGRLRDELVELRGPLPDGDDIMSICSENEAATAQHSIVSLLPQPLIHIWIPTAFLSGGFKGKSHHIYQIYIRLRDEEWNVYRRYSQFYTLHKSLKEKYPAVGELEFPPKKAIGNKDSKVVQERRKKLEFYLRNVINHLQVVAADVGNKDKLIGVLPFLSDKFFLQDRSQSETNLANTQANAAVAPLAIADAAPTAYMGF